MNREKTPRRCILASDGVSGHVYDESARRWNGTAADSSTKLNNSLHVPKEKADGLWTDGSRQTASAAGTSVFPSVLQKDGN